MSSFVVDTSATVTAYRRFVASTVVLAKLAVQSGSGAITLKIVGACKSCAWFSVARVGAAYVYQTTRRIL